MWLCLLASLIGSLTVLASKPVATFILMSLHGSFASCYNTEVRLEIADQAACTASNGFGLGATWRLADPNDLAAVALAEQIRNGSDASEYMSGFACYFTGVGQTHHSTFWISLLCGPLCERVSV